MTRGKGWRGASWKKRRERRMVEERGGWEEGCWVGKVFIILIKTDFSPGRLTGEARWARQEGGESGAMQQGGKGLGKDGRGLEAC